MKEIVFNTGETQAQLREKYNPEGSELRKLQMRMLDMLLYIDQVCKEQSIEWRLDGGNILGAVRHGGFIPWDDDIDVVLLPKEHKKLVDYLKKHPHPQYVLQDNDTDKGFYATNWAVLRDLKSEYIQDDRKHNARKYRGIQIDIFCYEDHLNKILFQIASKVTYFNNSHLVGVHPHLAQMLYNIQKYFVIPVCRTLGYPFSKAKVYGHAYGHLATRFHMKWLKHDIVFPLKPIAFEGYTFPGPNNVDAFLKVKYGDYMNLPPVDKRNHHQAQYKIWE